MIKLKEILASYIKKLSIEDIKSYCVKNNFSVSDKDLNTILYYIKNYWEDVYNGNTSIFNEIKKKIEPDSYQIMINLYNNYKKFI